MPCCQVILWPSYILNSTCSKSWVTAVFPAWPVLSTVVKWMLISFLTVTHLFLNTDYQSSCFFFNFYFTRLETKKDIQNEPTCMFIFFRQKTSNLHFALEIYLCRLHGFDICWSCKGVCFFHFSWFGRKGFVQPAEIVKIWSQISSLKIIFTWKYWRTKCNFTKSTTLN